MIKNRKWEPGDILEIFREEDGNLRFSFARWEADVTVLLMSRHQPRSSWETGIPYGCQLNTPLVNAWKARCTAKHGYQCQNPLAIAWRSPSWLIDTRMNCLVPGDKLKGYVALSYRWASSGSFKTSTANLSLLQQKNALAEESITGKLPKTIIDAISLARELDERYIWVDALCIVQDDDNSKMHDIHNMGAVYANATFTIVAADGDASTGLAGFRHLHLERPSLHIEQYTLMPTPFTNHEGMVIDSDYSRRGWTFQEYYVSGRKLIFYQGMAHWQCCRAAWHEDQMPEGESMLEPTLKLLASPDPGTTHFNGYEDLATAFSWRELTYEQDTVHAVSGIFNALSSSLGGSFRGGFLFGLPEMYFEAALLWRLHRYEGVLHKRRKGTFPSWTWLGWKGPIRFEETIDLGLIITTTQWFSLKAPEDLNKRRIYTIGLGSDSKSNEKSRKELEAKLTTLSSETYLACETRMAQAYVGRVDLQEGRAALIGSSSRFRFTKIGSIWIDGDSDVLGGDRGPSKGSLIDLVVICGRRHEHHAAGISGYAVMWVVWIEGVAYRRGYGEIDRYHWETLDPRPIDLVLG